MFVSSRVWRGDEAGLAEVYAGVRRGWDVIDLSMEVAAWIEEGGWRKVRVGGLMLLLQD